MRSTYPVELQYLVLDVLNEIICPGTGDMKMTSLCSIYVRQNTKQLSHAKFVCKGYWVPSTSDGNGAVRDYGGNDDVQSNLC